MLELQKRDHNLFRNLFKFGVMSTRQIASQVFSEIALTTVLRRLRLLLDHDLIICSGYLATGEKVWSISKLGAAAINESKIYKFSNMNTLQHDVCLTDIRFVLESLGPWALC